MPYEHAGLRVVAVPDDLRWMTTVVADSVALAGMISGKSDAIDSSAIRGRDHVRTVQDVSLLVSSIYSAFISVAISESLR